MTEPSIDEQKEVGYYGAAVTAWFTTSLEYDKSLLTLSAAGIGLHLTLLTTVGLRSAEGLVLYIGAILCFTAALLTVLRVFRLNQKHIEDIVSSRVNGPDPFLAKLDHLAIISFSAGVVFTAIVAISAAIHSYSESEKIMTDKQKPTRAVPTLDSVNGAAKLQPTKSVGKSFNGAAALQPSASQPVAQAAVVQPQATAPAVPTQTQSPPPSSFQVRPNHSLTASSTAIINDGQ